MPPAASAPTRTVATVCLLFCVVRGTYLALVGPLVVKLMGPDSTHDDGFLYACPLLYVSLFISLPGISVHFFCLFLLLSSRCRFGVAGYALSVAPFVLAIEIQYMYGPSHWLTLLPVRVACVQLYKA